MKKILCTILVSCLILPLMLNTVDTVKGDPPEAEIYGIVKDPYDKVIEGASIEAELHDINGNILFKETTETDSEGIYSLSIRTDDDGIFYAVTVKMDGYFDNGAVLYMTSNWPIRQDFMLLPETDSGWVEGYVWKDDIETPLVDVSVFVDNFLDIGVRNEGKTDNRGYFKIYCPGGFGYEITANAEWTYPESEYPRDSRLIWINERQATTIDFVLYKKSDDNSDGYLEGVITDKKTGEPIENAEIYAEGIDSNGYDSDKTDVNGHYKLSIKGGDRYETHVSKDQSYHSILGPYVYISAGKTSSCNFQMSPVSENDALLHGYVYEHTKRVKGALIIVIASDSTGLIYKETRTNLMGYYEFNLPGDHLITASAINMVTQGYYQINFYLESGEDRTENFYLTNVVKSKIKDLKNTLTQQLLQPSLSKIINKIKSQQSTSSASIIKNTDLKPFNQNIPSIHPVTPLKLITNNKIPISPKIPFQMKSIPLQINSIKSITPQTFSEIPSINPITPQKLQLQLQTIQNMSALPQKLVITTN